MKNNLAQIFVLFFLILFKTAAACWIYQPFSTHLKEADLILTAQVLYIKQEDSVKYAAAKPLQIIKGNWSQNSILNLAIHELPKTVIKRSTDYEVLYDSGATYLLPLKLKDTYAKLVGLPWHTQIKLDQTNISIIDDVTNLVHINSLTDPSEQALRYTELLASPYIIIRESVAWELGRIESEKALQGLIIAMHDTAENVIVNALAGFRLLGKKEITSSDAVASIESILVYSFHLRLLLGALAAQKGETAIPFLHKFFSMFNDPRGGALGALTYLKDTTAIGYFREAILDDQMSWMLKKDALEYLQLPDSIAIPFPDSSVIPLAMAALEDEHESVQKSAIRLLEKRTNISFGDVDAIRGFDFEMAKETKKIIKKWKNWYKDWQKK